MAWKKSSDPKRYQKSQVVLSVTLLVILIAVSFGAWKYASRAKQVQVITTPIGQSTQQVPQEEIIEESFDAIAIQAALKSWTSSISGEASVMITDVDGTVLATHQPDKQYFAASIYKLYVAYAGYQQVDAGTVDPQEVYVNDFTRAQCLDKMIRESDSPCAEKLWAEIGKQELTSTLQTYGITNTSMTALTTTSADAATMLSRIATGEGLSQSSQASYLQSMKMQVYRDTLNKGFSDSVTVYNKIGFNEQMEYHDTAIVELKDGRRLIVSVLTDGVGTANIIRLGAALELAIDSE